MQKKSLLFFSFPSGCDFGEAAEKNNNSLPFTGKVVNMQTNTNIAIMSTETMTRQIANYFKTQPVVRAWLFGSFARGEETPESDVDVLVEFDRTQPIGLFRYAQMHLDMEDMLGRKVDLVEDGMLRPAAALTAERDKKMIYERAD